jgi:hypothetical protein
VHVRLLAGCNVLGRKADPRSLAQREQDWCTAYNKPAVYGTWWLSLSCSLRLVAVLELQLACTGCITHCGAHLRCSSSCACCEPYTECLSLSACVHTQSHSIISTVAAPSKKHQILMRLDEVFAFPIYTINWRRNAFLQVCCWMMPQYLAAT